jgi:hypothetical protein
VHALRDHEAMRQGVYGRCPGESGAAGDSWPFRDEITWTGSFHGAPITFTTRPRLLTANASFLVPSNARLRTSILKRDEGHFIDLCVRGRLLSDDKREALSTLAQAQDAERPVRVRLAGEPVRGNAPVRPVRPPRPETEPLDPDAQLRLL